MKASLVLAAFATMGMFDSVLAYPGLGKTMADIKDITKTKRLTNRRSVKKRAVEPPGNDQNIELIGDLIAGATTPVGNTVLQCLKGTIDCYDDTKKTYIAPGTLGTTACKADTCCVWDWLGKELRTYFLHLNGRCNQHARAAVRQGFHDAGAWSKTTGFGGADGSLILSTTEINRAENNGLQAIRTKTQQLLTKYGPYGVNAADLVQFMAKVAVVTCPLGPRIRFFTGRATGTASPEGLLPDVNANAPSLIKLFQDKTIDVEGLVALVGAHTASNQFFVNKAKSGFPQDTTPGIWDVSFYTEVLKGTPSQRVFQFNSDKVLANFSQSNPEWTEFAANNADAQEDWNEDYSQAYVRLSLLGQNNINKMADCTKVMPDAVKVFPAFGLPKTDFNKNKDDGDIIGALMDIGTSLIDGMMGFLNW